MVKKLPLLVEVAQGRQLYSVYHFLVYNLVSLLRMVPPIDGEILIDGMDTSTVDLRVLRSRIAIIPQQPVLFSGTIRTNLDPFCLYSDDNIWKALKSVYLGEKIQEMPEKLDTPVSENGKTFSLAERQLFCIARAVLTRTKIVVFDGKYDFVTLRTFHCGGYRNG